MDFQSYSLSISRISNVVHGGVWIFSGIAYYSATNDSVNRGNHQNSFKTERKEGKVM